MSVTSYPPGWHPDPHLPAGTLRWWDGANWTERTQSVQGAEPSPPVAPAAADGAAGFVAYGAPSATPGFGEFTAGAGAALQQRPQRGLVERNPKTFTTIAVVFAYLVLASATGIVLIGIFPAILSVRAFQRREQLAPLAIASAAVAIVFSLSVLAHH
jgi:hypothetical protein